MSMKNISQAEVLVLKEQISYQEGQVVSKTLAQNSAVSITLFSFSKGEEISTHKSGGDAFVTCLDGVGRINIDGTEYLLHEGEKGGGLYTASRGSRRGSYKHEDYQHEKSRIRQLPYRVGGKSRCTGRHTVEEGPHPRHILSGLEKQSSHDQKRRRSGDNHLRV